MSIRKAISPDLQAIVVLTAECVAHMRAQGIEQWDEVYPCEAVFARDIAAGTLHVMDGPEGIMGCIVVDDRPDPLWQGLDWSPAGEPFAAVHRLMIRPACQGRGLAKQFMICAEEFAREQDRCSIRLDTFSANPVALALYEKLGYRRTGTARMRKGEFVGMEKLL